LRILFSSILCTCPNQCNLFNLTVSVIVLCYVWLMSTTAQKKITSHINTADCQAVFILCEVIC
jgi:tRNA C32,U32 (ribose-2'-O)-methylase TrmJ